MQDEPLKELWTRRLDGASLSAAEADELFARVSTGESLRKELMDDELFHGLLLSLARSEADAADFGQQVSDRIDAEADGTRFVNAFKRRMLREVPDNRRRVFAHPRRWAAGLAAASIALVLGAYLFLHRVPASQAELRVWTGDVQILRDAKPQALAKGTRLAASDTLVVPAGASVEVGYAGEQTMLELEPRTEARLWDEDGAKRIQLNAGSITADVAPQPSGRPLVLITPHLRVEVVGTRFSLEVDEQGTRIEMEHGRVKLRRPEDGKSVELTAGHFLEARLGADFAAQTIPTSGTVEFQEGLNGYAGMHDLSISTQGVNPNGTINRAKDLAVWRIETTNREKYEIRSLMRFDGIAIPRNARVTSAKLTLSIDTWNSDWHLQGYYVKAPWNAAPNSALGWLNRDQGKPWTVPGGRGDGTDVLAGKRFGIEGQTGKGTVSRTVELDAAIVQTWCTDPSANQGILFINPLADKTIRIFSSRASDASSRPKLTITWSR